MSAPTPMTMDKVSEDVQGIFSNLKNHFGFIPNYFGVMARSPEVLKAMLPMGSAILKKGKLDAKYRELAFLKTSLVNGCAY